jgi:crotonobetainyl-CoA:carnitine CoA-transferase CaiB-like acyl-CoA transferase
MYNMADEVNDPHLKAREFFVAVDRKEVGKLRYPGAPYKLHDAPWALKRPAPLLGEHNEEIYSKRLGYTKEDLTVLKGAGVI